MLHEFFKDILSIILFAPVIYHEGHELMKEVNIAFDKYQVFYMSSKLMKLF